MLQITRQPQDFAGMLKINLEEKYIDSGKLSLNINGLGYDDDRSLMEQE